MPACKHASGRPRARFSGARNTHNHDDPNGIDSTYAHASAEACVRRFARPRPGNGMSPLFRTPLPRQGERAERAGRPKGHPNMRLFLRK